MSPRRIPTRGACVAAATLLGLLAIPACGRSDGARSAGVVTSEVSQVLSRGDFSKELLLTGELQAVHSIVIKSPQTRIFQMRIQFMAEEGTEVSQGDPLLGFDDSSLVDQVRELDNQILDAETQIVSKQAELDSTLKDLEIEIAERQYEYGRADLDASIDPEVVSEKEFAERQVAFEKAARELRETQERIELTQRRGKADLDVLVINRDKLQKDLLSAKQSLGLLTVAAPADGLVVYEKRQGTTLRYQEGDSCWPGQGVISLPDLGAMQVVFNVNEVDAPLLQQGMPVRITLDAFPDRDLAGRIRNIPSMAVKRDETSKIAVFKVVAELDETWTGVMKPGMSARGTVVVDARHNVPLVDRASVVHDGESYSVRVAARAPVEINPVTRNAEYYVLTEDEYASLGGEAVDSSPARAAVAGAPEEGS